MRVVHGQMILEPQITGFQANILLEVVQRLHQEASGKARANPVDVASWVASMVEYDNITKALKAEVDLWNDYRTRIKPHGRRVDP